MRYTKKEQQQIDFLCSTPYFVLEVYQYESDGKTSFYVGDKTYMYSLDTIEGVSEWANYLGNSQRLSYLENTKKIRLGRVVFFVDTCIQEDILPGICEYWLTHTHKKVSFND